MTSSPINNNNSSWQEYKKLVLAELERHNAGIMELHKKIDQIRQEDLPAIRTEIAMLKLKASFLGGVAGLGAAIGAILVRMLLVN